MSQNDVMLAAEARNTSKDKLPKFEIGDTVDVQVRIAEEGDKTRIQLFSGVVIAMKHGGLRGSFTVRRIVDGEGVERTFPNHSPSVVGVEVKRHGVARRAKLYYLRDRVGKATRLRERVGQTVAEETSSEAKKKGRKRGAKAKAERKARAAAEGAPKKNKKKKAEAKA